MPLWQRWIFALIGFVLLGVPSLFLMGWLMQPFVDN